MFNSRMNVAGSLPGFPIFDFDEARTKEAESQLRLLAEITHISNLPESHDIDHSKIEKRNKYYAEMVKFRLSPYFLQIKARFGQHQKLVPAEMYFYAMATDDVSKLQVEVLREVSYYYHDFAFESNFNVLLCALQWQNETTDAAKLSLCIELRKRFIERVSRFAHKNDIVHWLNLRGINLTGADLTAAQLHYIDFEVSNLSASKLGGAQFECCILDGANLSNSSCYSDESDSVCGPSIGRSSARGTCFDRMSAFNDDSWSMIHWDHSDFTGASFRDATIGPVSFCKSVLDHADIENGVVMFGRGIDDDCSMHQASLIGAVLHGTDFKFLEPSTKFLSDDVLLSTDVLSDELTQLSVRFSQKSEKYMSDPRKVEQLAALSIKLANSLVYQLDKSNLSDDEKIELLNYAIQQSIFQPEGVSKWMANTASRYYQAASSMFSSSGNQHHEYHTTPAIEILEGARDVCLTRVHHQGSI